MVERWIKKYSQAISNAQINATLNETFTVNAGNYNAFGDANGLIITNLSTENILIELDGIVTDPIAFGVGTFGIEPKDGRNFRTVRITNLDAVQNILAAELRGHIFKSELVSE